MPDSRRDLKEVVPVARFFTRQAGEPRYLLDVLVARKLPALRACMAVSRALDKAHDSVPSPRWSRTPSARPCRAAGHAMVLSGLTSN